MRLITALLCVLCLATISAAAESKPLKALLIDGQNNHNWKATSPLLKKQLEETGRFTVDVATVLPADVAKFKPDFTQYDVVVSNYNGALWPTETRTAFEQYMRNGGGLVIVHAADNSFPEWLEYNKMIGLGGWGGRNEKSGPYLRWRDGQVVRDTRPGPGGGHGAQHEFLVETRNADHPIMAGLPEKWLHIKDELYDKLRGPAENVTILATAFSSKQTGGTGEHEPALFTIDYGKGRVFHTILGHDEHSTASQGFVTTYQRGAEWAATGKVTLPVPANFPTAQKTSVWRPAK